ncbi:MAG: lipid II flippase MurJ, partial [Patescibacteria group bacterium]
MAFFALLSQILALLRDRLLAGTFGAGETLDLYYAAFRLPDLLFATVASLLSLYALLPIIARLAPEDMHAFLERSLLVFFAAMGIIAAAAFAAAPYILSFILPGLAGDGLTELTRILLLPPLLLGASNIVAALTQLKQRFLLYSLSPLLYNLGIILGIVVLYPYVGLRGLAWGVVVGAAFHLLIQLPFWGGGGRSRMSWRDTIAGLGEVLKLSVPRTLALAAGQISLLILVALASLMEKGSIAVFMFAFNLQAVPLAIIGVSYSVAAFPTLSRLHAAGEWHEFARHIETALRHVLFWSVPVIVFVIVLRAQLVRAILGTGMFEWPETRLVAAALALFIVSLAAQSITLLVSRGYYAAGDTAKPLIFGALSVVVAVGSGLMLMRLFAEWDLWRLFLEEMLRVDGIAGTPILMLALAYCL